MKELGLAGPCTSIPATSIPFIADLYLSLAHYFTGTDRSPIHRERKTPGKGTSSAITHIKSKIGGFNRSIHTNGTDIAIQTNRTRYKHYQTIDSQHKALGDPYTYTQNNKRGHHTHHDTHRSKTLLFKCVHRTGPLPSAYDLGQFETHITTGTTLTGQIRKSNIKDKKSQ